jgi:hypothetical protein
MLHVNWNSVALVLVAIITKTNAFVVSRPNVNPTQTSRDHVPLFYSNRKGGHDESEGFDAGTLTDRLNQLRVTMLEEELKRPPNPDLTPYEFVIELLHGLWHNSDPLPDSGFRLLLRASTTERRAKLYESVGAPASAAEEVVASALGEAMGRPKNQFGILVAEAERYVCAFPSDTLDYADGTCWIECRLRNKVTNELLVAIGWSLKQRSDEAWLVDAIDWQDFRDDFRPGIGREEWMRICG